MDDFQFYNPINGKQTLPTIDTQFLDKRSIFTANSSLKIKHHKYNLKTILIKSIKTYAKYPYVSSLVKLLIGFLLLGLPTIIFYFLIYVIYPVYIRYLILPFIISFSLCTALMLLFLIVKCNENWIKYGPIFPSWERQSCFSTLSCISFNIFMIIISKQLEGFFFNISILKGNISQVKEEIHGKTLNQGTFIFKLLFIGLLWDSKHEELDYFELPNNFQREFKNELTAPIKPILILACYYLFSLIFFNSKNTIEHISLCIIIIFESFYLILFPIGDSYDYKKISFLYSNTQYFELIPLIILSGIISWLMVKKHIVTLYTDNPYSNIDKNIVTIIIALVSFILVMIGLIGLIMLLLIILTVDITRKHFLLIII